MTFPFFLNGHFQCPKQKSETTFPPLSDVGGDTPAAAAYSSADLIIGIENKWGNTKFFMPTAAKILKRGPRVDSQRIQAVVTKRESESFCGHKFIKLSLVIKDNLC